MVETARALFNFGLALASWGRPEQEVEAAYRDAMVAGQEAATPAGLLLSAQALLGLGSSTGWVRPEQEVETAYREAAEAARESATPEGSEVIDLVSGFTQGTKQRVRAISSLRSQSGLEYVPGGGNFTISWTAETGRTITRPGTKSRGRRSGLPLRPRRRRARRPRSRFGSPEEARTPRKGRGARDHSAPSQSSKTVLSTVHDGGAYRAFTHERPYRVLPGRWSSRLLKNHEPNSGD